MVMVLQEIRRYHAGFPTKENAMGLISFIKDAGQKLFGSKEVEKVQAEAAAKPDDEALKAKAEAENEKAAEAIVAYIRSQNLDARALDVMYDGATATVNVYGVAADQATKEKILLCCGNVSGVAKVNDKMEVDDPQPEAAWHTVVSGDTLSKISKAHYSDANKYMVIFEANQPMLSHPDKIYPGQVLRIPPL
jgi:nucleoid-associated protein YgaU